MTRSEQTSSARIVIADDDDVFRSGLTRLLARHGYECLEAANAGEAIQHLKSIPCDALIADVQMPGNTGLELIKRLSEYVPGLPVVLMTGQPSVETAIRAVGLPVAAYLIKPPPMDELLTVLRGSVAGYRRLRWVDDSRARLSLWETKLEELADGLRRSRITDDVQPAGDHFRLTLQHVMLELNTLDQTIAAWRRETHGAHGGREADLTRAIRHAISVLEQTKQNFKSQRLADLRRQLVALLNA